jgi:hypothetical protein
MLAIFKLQKRFIMAFAFTTPRSICVFALLSLAAQQAFAAEPEVTPYRPGAGSPAVLSAIGYFEVEAGYDYLKYQDVRADAIGLILKYGLTDQFGLLLGVSPYARTSSPYGSQSGTSDSLLGLKFVSKVSSATALGAQLVTTLPTGSSAFRSDKPIVTFTGLAGFDFSGLHSDINLGVTRFGDGQGTGVSKNRFNWSAGLSSPLNGALSGAIELSGTQQSGSVNSTQFLASLGYAVSKKLVIDVYVARARAETNGGGSSVNLSYTSFGTGLTYLFAK